MPWKDPAVRRQKAKEAMRRLRERRKAEEPQWPIELKKRATEDQMMYQAWLRMDSYRRER